MSQSAYLETPKKRGSQIMHIAAQARLSHYRREAQLAAERLRKTRRSLLKRPADVQPQLQLIAYWEGDLEALRDFIEMASDWGPFELVSIKSIGDGQPESPQRALCVFDYHADAATRDHLEAELRAVLRRVTRWESAPTDQPHQASA
jgi:hypothetical protein